MTELNVAREYRDRLFKFIFGNPENKEWTLSLYNAMNGSKYTNPDDIILNTIDDVVYMGMKNDVSFLIDNTLNLYEQQSTFNPNMPMRFLIYLGMLFNKYIEQSPDYHRYSSKLQCVPTPKCVCFYNGRADKDDKTILKLSDAFIGKIEPDVDLRVTMININYGHNIDLLNVCKPLEEYSMFVDNVREKQKRTALLSSAIDMALAELPDDSIIKPFLMANKAEVTNMCITEYDEAKTFLEQRIEGYEDGRAEGRAEGSRSAKIETARNFLQMGLTNEQVAQGTGLSLDEIQNLK